MNEEVNEYLPREPKGTIAHKVKFMGRSSVRRKLKEFGVLKYISSKVHRIRTHQLCCILIGLVKPRWMFALDMRTGKTRIAIELFKIKKKLGICQKGLIIAPPVTLYEAWDKQLSQYAPNLSWQILDGSAIDKETDFFNSDADLVIASLDWATRFFGREKLHKDIKKRAMEFDFCVIDEAHRLSNPKGVGFARVTDCIMGIPHFYLMTGTPAGNHYFYIFGLYFMLDGGKTYGTDYQNYLDSWFEKSIRFFYMYSKQQRRKVRVPIPVYGDILADRKTKFFSLFWKKAVRWEKTEIGEFSKTMFLRTSVEMLTGQAELYDRILARQTRFYDEKNKAKTLNNLLRLLGGCLRRLDNDFVIPPQRVPKIQALCKIVDRICVEDKQQLVIWHSFIDEGKLITLALAERYPNMTIGEFRSDIPKKVKDRNLTAWKNNKVDIIVAHPDSLGIGVTLNEANVAVYYSRDRKYITRAQSAERITKTDDGDYTVKIIDLVHKDTMDEIMLDDLNAKKDAFKGLTKDAIFDNIVRRKIVIEKRRVRDAA